MGPFPIRALVVPAAGAAPELREIGAPAPEPGRALVRLRAAGLNPADLAIAAGRFYLPPPEPPFVAGCEAVGEVVESARYPAGTRVWCLQPTGCFADLLSCPDEALVPVPDGISDVTAAALGVAGLAGWMPVGHRGGMRPGETVLVLGASGAVGQVALQAARLAGAGRVVGAVRGADGAERVLAAGADEAVVLGGPDDAAALRAASGGGADLVIDTLWGEPLTAALGVLRRGGRIVQVGSGAAPVAALPAGPLRGGRLDVRGFSVFSERREDLHRAYAELASAAGRGEVRLPTEEVPLACGPAAWTRQAQGTGGVKLVLVP